MITSQPQDSGQLLPSAREPLSGMRVIVVYLLSATDQSAEQAAPIERGDTENLLRGDHEITRCQKANLWGCVEAVHPTKKRAQKPLAEKGGTRISITPLIAEWNNSNQKNQFMLPGAGGYALKRGYFLCFVLRIPGTERIPVLSLFTPVYLGCQ